MRLLLIDNHDSFTAILHHYLWAIAGERPLLYRNDELTRDELEALAFDAVVLSPGPGHPAHVRDFGVCRDILELYPDVPVLGVCLGMQGLAHFAGARVVPWDGALHGRPSRIAHDGTGLFRGIPDEFTAIRYHSLVVDPASLPITLRVTARAVEDGHVMGLAFTDRPWYGVQFHPEAFATEYGKELLANFLDLATPNRRQPGQTPEVEKTTRPSSTLRPGDAPPKKSPLQKTSGEVPHVELSWRDPAEAFTRYLSNVTNTFWIDGAAWGSAVMGRADQTLNFAEWSSWKQWVDSLSLERERTAPWSGYRGGPVGHLAYELHRETLSPDQAGVGENGTEPLARWLLPAGWLVFDRAARVVWAAWDGERPPAWLNEVIASWDAENTAPRIDPVSASALPAFASWRPLLKEPEYVARVALIQDAIAAGETYEACLTHAFSTVTEPGAADPLRVFLRLCTRNAAPYAAYFSFGDLDVLSASPELFLESSDGLLHSHPIKGTRRRGSTPATDRAMRDELATSEKDAAENRMIVDLTRHDLARVCESGSVEVTAFLRVEEHPAVFQLVSDVQGRLAPGVTASEAIAACFPGGSMTGAPKERTVEILSTLEREPRGAYSGAIGYLSGGGTFVLSMVIRTIEHRRSPAGDVWRIGCGGAVLADSDATSEWREATLKARSVIDAVS